jgi:hypothetical protein
MEKNQSTQNAIHVANAPANETMTNLIGETFLRSAKDELRKKTASHDQGAPKSMTLIQYSLIYHPQIHTP